MFSFLCYLTLFISERATIAPNRTSFYYANKDIKASIQQIVTNYVSQIASDEDNTTFDSLLFRKLGETGFYFEPEILGIICFENCPLLKQLYKLYWHHTGVNITQINYPSIALVPSTNPFLYGTVLRYTPLAAPPHCVFTAQENMNLILSLLDFAAQIKELSTPPNAF